MKPQGRSETTPDELLITGAQDLGIRLNPDQVAAFRLYREEILRWSERMNLTALTTSVEIIYDGFLDSLACLAVIPPGVRMAVDVGSGAGFPAIPIAIVHEGLNFTLVEASRKKATFLKHIVRLLDLRRVRVEHERVQRPAGALGTGVLYEVAFARAVAPLLEQAALVSSFLRSGGIFVAQTGAVGPPALLQKRLREIGYQPVDECRVPAWGGGVGRLILTFRWVGRLGGGECFT